MMKDVSFFLYYYQVKRQVRLIAIEVVLLASAACLGIGPESDNERARADAFPRKFQVQRRSRREGRQSFHHSTGISIQLYLRSRVYQAGKGFAQTVPEFYGL